MAHPELATALALGLALTAAAVLVWWRARKKAKSKPEDLPVKGEPPAAVSSLPPWQLRRAWFRFLRKLPQAYRRSVADFEHVVVLGDASSGKSSLIRSYTDWQRQTKQFLGSQDKDPDLQVYLGSGVVVTEVPSRLGGEPADRVRKALVRLWRPLYANRPPAIVVVVDASRLRSGTEEAATDLAERLRGQINALSSVARRPLSARVVLTHLDELEGWTEVAALHHSEWLPLYLPFKATLGRAASEDQLGAWAAGVRDQLPRALVRLPAGDFRKAIALVRELPGLVPRLAAFLDALHAKEALSQELASGGLYFASTPAGAPNPLRNANVDGKPRKRDQFHRIIAAAAAGVAALYLSGAFALQRASWQPAAQAVVDYNSALVGSRAEASRREGITAFTSTSRNPLQRFPDFYARPRQRMRAAISERMRDAVLIPNLQKVASSGSLKPGEMSLPWRRTLFYLAVVHGDRFDGLHVLNPSRLKVWAQMTELPPDFITDYLELTDVAWTEPVEFHLSEASVDPRDQAAFWESFLAEIDRVTALGSLDSAQLDALQKRATDVEDALERFASDEIAVGIFDALDDEGSMASKPGRVVQLEASYRPRFEGFLRNLSGAKIFVQRGAAQSILDTVKSARIEVTPVTSLRGLNEELAKLYEVPVAPAPSAAPITITLDGRDHSFDPTKWADLIRDSKALALTTSLARTTGGARSIFGPPSGQALPNVSWNSTNDGTALFVGSGTIDGPHTRAGYDQCVHDPVRALEALLPKVHLSDARKAQLETLIVDQVRQYAVQYGVLLGHFIDSFGIEASSPEALRVALAQMSAETSAFSYFVNLVAAQASAATDSPLLAPMAEALANYRAWPPMTAAAGGGELGKYRAILGQLLVDLGPASAGAGASRSAPPAPLAASAPATTAGAETGAKRGDAGSADDESLEAMLSPVGRAAMNDLLAAKGAYSALVAEWVESMSLPSRQQAPFVAPLRQLAFLGDREISRAVATAWRRDLLPPLQALVAKFPFDPAAAEEVLPYELDALLDPKSGRFFELFRRYVEPISDLGDGSPFREKAALRGHVKIPDGMYAVINRVGALAARLYGADGKPAPLAYSVRTVPFSRGADAHNAVTTNVVSVGDVSVYGFNQKPSARTMRIDWTKEQVAQVAAQYMNVDTRETTVSDPLVTSSSHWSVLRLLRVAAVGPPGETPGGTTYSWTVRAPGGGSPAIVKLVVMGNPWAPFTLGITARPKGPDPT